MCFACLCVCLSLTSPTQIAHKFSALLFNGHWSIAPIFFLVVIQEIWMKSSKYSRQHQTFWLRLVEIMSNLEEKILNGPQIHYCEDGDDDIREEEVEQGEDDEKCSRGKAESLFTRVDHEETSRGSRAGSNTNPGAHKTGPKGVIEDFKKQAEADALEAEFQALMNDDAFLKELASRRLISNMQQQQPTFGRVFRLQTGPELLDAIDKEN